MRALSAVLLLLGVSLAPAAHAQGAGPACPATSNVVAPLDTSRFGEIVGSFEVVLVDTAGIGGDSVKHRGRLTLWLQDTRPTRRGLPTRPLHPGQKLLAGAWDAAAPDTGAQWRRMAQREHESPGALWQDGFLRLGEFGAALGLTLYIRIAEPSQLRGTWNSGSGIGVTVDYTGAREREEAGFFCATRIP